METNNLKTSDEAARVIAATDGSHLMEEYAMVHLSDFAFRLEKHYARQLKKAGLGTVDYFGVARHFTQSMLDRFAERDRLEAELFFDSDEAA